MQRMGVIIQNRFSLPDNLLFVQYSHIFLLNPSYVTTYFDDFGYGIFVYQQMAEKVSVDSIKDL